MIKYCKVIHITQRVQKWSKELVIMIQEKNKDVDDETDITELLSLQPELSNSWKLEQKS